MLSRLMAFVTMLFRTVPSAWRSTSPGHLPDGSSISSGNQRITNSATLWQTFTDLFRSRRILELEKLLAAERESRLLIEGQLVTQRGEIDYLREQAGEALKNERLVYQMQVNVNMQSKFGITPFPAAPAIPDSLTSHPQTPIANDYVMARTLQDEGWQSFRSQAAERFKRH